MPPLNKNQKLARGAYAVVAQSGKYSRMSSALNKALQLARAAHVAARRTGRGPTSNDVWTAAVNYEIKETNKVLKKK
jgi:GH43 family beta-xylosidase